MNPLVVAYPEIRRIGTRRALAEVHRIVVVLVIVIVPAHDKVFQHRIRHYMDGRDAEINMETIGSIETGQSGPHHFNGQTIHILVNADSLHIRRSEYIARHIGLLDTAGQGKRRHPGYNHLIYILSHTHQNVMLIPPESVLTGEFTELLVFPLKLKRGSKPLLRDT